MRFAPKTAEEVSMFNLMPEGTYNFEVFSAKEKMSKTGNEMIELQMKVWDIEGKEHIVFDYLLEAMAFKLRHFCEATGLLTKYEQGILTAEDCISKCGKVKITIQKGGIKDDGTRYEDKNSVKDYMVVVQTMQAKSTSKKKSTTTSNTNLAEEMFDDDVPF